MLPHFSRRPRGVVKVSCARGPDANLPVEPDVFGLTPVESRARVIELLEFAATLEAAATFETRVVLSLQWCRADRSVAGRRKRPIHGGAHVVDVEERRCCAAPRQLHTAASAAAIPAAVLGRVHIVLQRI